jgi:hypothetical protein
MIVSLKVVKTDGVFVQKITEAVKKEFKSIFEIQHENKPLAPL